MRSIKFKLLYDGDEGDLESKVFESSAHGQSVTFTIGELLDINHLRETMPASGFEEMTQYFSFPGFSQYYVKKGNTLFVILYRQFQQRHQIYERGHWTLNN